MEDQASSEKKETTQTPPAVAQSDPATQPSAATVPSPTPPQKATQVPTAVTNAEESEKPPTPEAKPEAKPETKPQVDETHTHIVISVSTPSATPTSAAATPSPATAPVAKVSNEVTIVKELLNAYKAVLTTKGATAPMIKAAATNLGNVVTRVLNDHSDAVFDVVWSFFVENKNGVCQESSALQDVNTLNNTLQFQVEIFYTLFRKAVAGLDVSNPQNVHMDVVRTRLKCPQLMIYLQRKAAQVTATKAS